MAWFREPPSDLSVRRNLQIGAPWLMDARQPTRRVASVVDEMNYAQRRTMELFLGLDGNRR